MEMAMLIGGGLILAGVLLLVIGMLCQQAGRRAN
jgi:hypothetical protein